METALDAVAPIPLAETSRQWLLFVARRALRDAMAQRDPAAQNLPIGFAERPDDARLTAPAGVYVTWYDGNEEVGRLGSLDTRLPLEQAVARYAIHAGLDPKLAGARRSRWHRLIGEICVLGAPQMLAAQGLLALAETLVPGRDGVILTVGNRQPAVSLPSGWRQTPRPRDLLTRLMRTLGLSPEQDGPRLRGQRFLAETFAQPVAPARPAVQPTPDVQLGA